MSLSNAILHNSAVRAKHTRTRTHVGLYFVRLLMAQWVVIGQYAKGRSLMDWFFGGKTNKNLLEWDLNLSIKVLMLNKGSHVALNVGGLSTLSSSLCEGTCRKPLHISLTSELRLPVLKLYRKAVVFCRFERKNLYM